MRRLIVILALLVAAAACGPKNVLKEGEVVDHDYDDPDTWTTLDCAAYDGNMRCLVYVNNTHHDGPHWKIQIVGDDDEGKQRKEWHEVTQTLHDAVQVGQYVRLSDQSIVLR